MQEGAGQNYVLQELEQKFTDKDFIYRKENILLYNLTPTPHLESYCPATFMHPGTSESHERLVKEVGMQLKATNDW